MVKVSWNMYFDSQVVHLVPNFDTDQVFHFSQYLHKFTGRIDVPTDFNHSDTLQYTMVAIADSIIDVSTHTSSERVDIIPKKVL